VNRREFSQLLVGTALAQASGRAQTAPSARGFQFSVMIWTLKKPASLEHSVEIVAAAGFQGIELTNEVKTWTTEDIRKFKAKVQSLGLVVDAMSGGGYTLADPAATPALLDGLTQRIPLAKELGCNLLILTSGARVDGLSPEAERAAIIDNLKRVADLVAKSNMRVVIEPIDLLENPHAYLNSVADGFEIAKAVGSQNVKVLYDFYHEQRAAGNLIEKLEKNIDWVELVHIADVPGRHEPGTGEIDYLNIYRKLAELKYNKFIAMEFYPTGDPVQTLKTARLAAIGAESAGSAS
jgi:hydroxypyruvate isomerase